MSKQNAKVKNQKIDLFKLIMNNLKKKNIGKVTNDKFSDNSAQWIDIKKESKILCILFDMEGNIEEFNLYEEITQVVDTKKIF